MALGQKQIIAVIVVVAITVTIGGMITEKKIKYTKNDKIMAFLTVEDMYGSMETIVFPQTYEKFGSKIVEDSKVLIQGRVQAEDEKDGKLICEKIIEFDEIPRKVWLKFPTMEDYQDKQESLKQIITLSDGNDTVVIYIESTKQMKTLPPNQCILADINTLDELQNLLGKENVKVVY